MTPTLWSLLALGLIATGYALCELVWRVRGPRSRRPTAKLLRRPDRYQQAVEQSMRERVWR